jgi:predicted MFS family arabinose efflux permease
MSDVKPQRRPWLALQATLAAQVMASFVMSVAPILAPAVAPALGLAPEQVGFFVGGVYAVAMVAGLCCGPLVARFGAGRVTQGVLVVIAAGTMLGAIGQTLILFGLAAGLIGLGYGTVNPAAADILGRHAPPGAPGLFFSLKQTGVPIGVGLAGLLMPLGLGLVGWRGAAWAVAFACLLLALALGPAVSRLDGADRTRARTRTEVPDGPSGLSNLLAVLRHPPLRALSLVTCVYALAQQGFLTFVVARLYLELGLSLALAAGLLAASQVACVVARITLGHVADRWVSPRVLLSVMGLCMALNCLALGLLPRDASFAVITLVVIACGATTMGWNGVFFAQLLRTVPREDLVASSGGTQFFIFFGGMLGPVLFSALVQQGGSHALGYLCLAGVTALAALAMLRTPAVAAVTISSAEAHGR